jgi:uncharacterized protein HemY
VSAARGEPELPRRFEEVAEALRASGETRWLILAMSHLAAAYAEQGDTERAESLSAEGIALAREKGDVRGEAVTMTNLAYARTVEDDVAGAAKLLDEALTALRTINDTYGIAMCSTDLAQLAIRRGDVDRAAEYLAEGIPLSVSIGAVLVTAHMLPLAAAVALARGKSAPDSTTPRRRGLSWSSRQRPSWPSRP